MSPEVEIDKSDDSPLVRILRDDAADGVDPVDDVVFLHGFSQNADCAGTFVDGLTGRFRVRSIDLPGHRSGSRPVPGSDPFGWTADMISRTTGPADYVGYSMGGRIALHLALAHPEVVRRLVLIGATAGIEDPAIRSERRTSDDLLATGLERSGLEQFLDEWLAQPLFRHLPRSGAFIDRRLENAVEGLAWSLRNMGTGSMEPLWSRLSGITCPVLIVVGAEDERYRSIGERLVATIGSDAEMVVVPDVGHSVHLEAPLGTAHAISNFLSRSDTDRDRRTAG